MTLTVVSAGLLTLLQDAGRSGYGSVGVSPSGAFDRSAFRQVNRLLGHEAAPVLEVLGGGLTLRADGPHIVAVTGGVGPLAIDGENAAHGRALPIAAGQTLELGTITSGLRAYVGVAGGFDAHRVLGSASSDVLSGLGPAPVTVHDVLPVGEMLSVPAVEDVPALITTGEHLIDVVMGPRDDWFSADAWLTLTQTPWRVGAASNRVGIRLEGPALERSRSEELPSEPCARGSIQVANDGSPVVFGPDHPVTGGYPVIAVVADSHTDRLAQARPGDIVRFSRRVAG